MVAPLPVFLSLSRGGFPLAGHSALLCKVPDNHVPRWSAAWRKVNRAGGAKISKENYFTGGSQMKRYGVVAALAALAAGIGVWARAETPMPAVGQPAPDFSLLGSDGKAHGLKSLRGQKPVILAFYPKAFTGG
jgi:hypothetical protein